MPKNTFGGSGAKKKAAKDSNITRELLFREMKMLNLT